MGKKVIQSLDNNLKGYGSIKGEYDDISSQLADIAYNVKSFGAKCDGVTDDSVAIQTALNYLESIGGGILHFPYKKTVRVTMQGIRAIQNWHTSPFNRRYALLVPSNVEIDFNYCTISCDTFPTANGYALVNIIENKHANSDTNLSDVNRNASWNGGDSNITLRNVIFDSKVLYNDPTLSVSGILADKTTFNCDMNTVCFNNIDGLLLDNVKIINSMEYAWFITNARNVKVINGISVERHMGCGFRLGWYDGTDNIKIDRLDITDISLQLNADNYVPSNTFYCVATNVNIGRYYSGYTTANTPVDVNKSDESVIRAASNFANSCQHIYIGESYCYYTGHKFQYYTSSPEINYPAPDDIYVGKMYLYKSICRIQAQKTHIIEFIGEEMLYTRVDNGYTFIDRLYLNNSGNLYIADGGQEIYIKDGTLINTHGLNTATSTTYRQLKIDKISFFRNSDSNFSASLNLNNARKSLLYSQIYTEIGTVYIYNDPALTLAKNSNVTLNLQGSTIEKAYGQNESGTKFLDNFTFTLSAGTHTQLNLFSIPFDSTGTMFHPSNDMTIRYEIQALDTAGRALKLTNIHLSNSAYRLEIDHDTAVGTEKFYIRITKYIKTPTVTW